MSKILIVGDVHLRDTPAVNNTPAALEDVWSSLEFIATESSKHDATVFAGDVFDFKNPAKTSHALILRALRVFGSMHNVYAVAGNHDLSADRIESLHAKQPLGVLIEAGVIKHLDGWMHDDYSEAPNLPVFGQPWLQEWENPTARMYAFTDFRTAKTYPHNPAEHRLVITHAPIFPPGTEPPYEFLPLTDTDALSSALTPGTSVYYGHIHDFHGIFTADGITYANAGSLNRARLVASDLTRLVCVTTWDSATGQFEFMPVPGQADAASIFRLDAATAAKGQKADLDAFLAQVGRSSIDIATHEGLIAHVRALDAPESVKQRAVDLLRAQEP